MPIEIKELNIKAYVNDNSIQQNTGQQNPEMMIAENKEAIVAACVEQVLQILKDKKER